MPLSDLRPRPRDGCRIHDDRITQPVVVAGYVRRSRTLIDLASALRTHARDVAGEIVAAVLTMALRLASVLSPEDVRGDGEEK